MNFSDVDTSKLSFTDIKTDTWIAQVAQKAFSLGITSGYEDGTFRPDANISRIEAVKFVLKLKQVPLSEAPSSFTDVDIPWMIPYANTALNQ